MTVAELIARLAAMPQDAEVLTWGSGELAAMGDALESVTFHDEDRIVWVGLAC